MGKMKIKAKAKGDIVKVKAMFTSLMADKEEAEKKKIKPEYITQITAKHNGKVVFDVSTSGFMAENPLFKFQFIGGKKGEKIEFTPVDNNGETKTGKKKIK
jgi:sulfur-oxidizing protein SoxZ